MLNDEVIDACKVAASKLEKAGWKGGQLKRITLSYQLTKRWLFFTARKPVTGDLACKDLGKQLWLGRDGHLYREADETLVRILPKQLKYSQEDLIDLLRQLEAL